jgi:hypothetical protein
MIYDTIWFFEKIELDSIGIHICQEYVPVFDNCPTMNYLFFRWAQKLVKPLPQNAKYGHNVCSEFLYIFFN